jgi:hypothetical protein
MTTELSLPEAEALLEETESSETPKREALTHPGLEDLQTAVNQEIEDARSFTTGELASQRKKALDYYYGRKFGNEREGRSQVVLTHVRDVIEWQLPDLVDLFSQSDDVVKYEPQGPEDEEGAKQASDYANYVFYRLNPGFLILYCWFKDALRQKNGYVKRYWEPGYERDREEHRGLTEPELVELLGDPDVEPLEYSERLEPVPVPLEDGSEEQKEVPVADVVLLRRRPGQIVIQNVAPEDLEVARDTRGDLQEARFVRHRLRKTRRELVMMGYPKEEVENWPTNDEAEWGEEETARNTVEDESTWGGADEGSGPNRTVRLSECYLRWDMDGDDEAELLKVWVVGEGRGKIIDWEPVDEIPFSYLTPIPEPHRHYGLSTADQVMDLQEIDSAMLRQFLDNLYQANNMRPIVRETRVNMDDLMKTAPGAPVRVKLEAPGSIQDNILYPQMPIVAPQALQCLEYTSTIREERTGISRYNQGMQADTLNKTARGIYQIQQAGQKRLKLIARIFAETGGKDLFKAILRLSRHDKQRVIRLRNEFVQVDPNFWNRQMDVTITLPMGAGDREHQVAQLTSVSADQGQIVQAGGLGILVEPKHIFETMKRKLEAMGFKDAEAFFRRPEEGEQPPGEGPDPELVKLEQEAKIEAAKLELEQAKLALERQKAEWDHQEAMAKLEVERAKTPRGEG